MLTPASTARVKRFVDAFIRSETMQNWTAENDSDFINHPDRAARCHDAAEFGGDGKTHAEVIEDWRACFRHTIRDGELRRVFPKMDPERFVSAVEAHFDGIEAWHERNGSLHQEIG